MRDHVFYSCFAEYFFKKKNSNDFSMPTHPFIFLQSMKPIKYLCCDLLKFNIKDYFTFFVGIQIVCFRFESTSDRFYDANIYTYLYKIIYHLFTI